MAVAKWEYCVVTPTAVKRLTPRGAKDYVVDLPNPGLPILEKRAALIAALGSEGWEFAGDFGDNFILKRPL